MVCTPIDVVFPNATSSLFLAIMLRLGVVFRSYPKTPKCPAVRLSPIINTTLGGLATVRAGTTLGL